MSRRKRTPLKPQTVIASIMLCTALCLAGIGYIWAKAQVWSLGKERKTLENRLDELKRKNDVLKQTYAAMCTQSRLDESVRRLKLGLAAPQPDQIVRITEPAPQPRTASSGGSLTPASLRRIYAQSAKGEWTKGN
jgi:hypothetical protein